MVTSTEVRLAIRRTLITALRPQPRRGWCATLMRTVREVSVISHLRRLITIIPTPARHLLNAPTLIRFRMDARGCLLLLLLRDRPGRMDITIRNMKAGGRLVLVAPLTVMVQAEAHRCRLARGIGTLTRPTSTRPLTTSGTTASSIIIIRSITHTITKVTTVLLVARVILPSAHARVVRAVLMSLRTWW